MQRASTVFNEQQRNRVEQSVAEAEAKTSCELVPVVASASGRYDRPEDIVGVWFAVVAAIGFRLLVPGTAQEHGSWDGFRLELELFLLVVTLVSAFIAGATIGSRIGWLRRLFTSRQQMREEVSLGARQAFFDQRVHHTKNASGLLIYLSLFERTALVLADQEILDHPALGQAFLDRLCQKLTEQLHQGTSIPEALCQILSDAGQQLAGPMPRTQGSVDKLPNALVLRD